MDPFFEQVWDPLHDPDELREYPKEVSEKMCESIPDPEHSIEIVEINGEGNAWRIVWGLEGGAEIALAASELMKKIRRGSLGAPWTFLLRT